MTRYDRYQALKRCVLRNGIACLADRPTERTIARADGVSIAWERVGRLLYPMAAYYPKTR